jgi:DNA polymerase III subunit beta
MKISVLQENLNKGLSLTSHSVSSRATLPILSNILLETREGRLKLSATNLEIGISLLIGVKIEQEGSIAIPARVLADFISSLPAEKIDLETKDTSLFISSGEFKANIAGMEAAEFPKLPAFPSQTTLSVDKDAFIKAISCVVIAAAQDEGRPVLTGVLIEGDKEKLSLVSTDGYRLSIKTIPVKDFEMEGKLLIPAKTLLEVAKIAQEDIGESKDVRMGLTPEKSQVVFGFPNVELSSRLIEGEFPDYQKIVPQASTTKAIFQKDEFLRAVRIASVFAREQANIVKMIIDPENGKIMVTAETPQVGGNESGVEAKIEGEKLEIAFNCRFLMDFLGIANSQEIVFEANGPLSPGVFRLSGDNSFVHIIMPVRLQS